MEDRPRLDIIIMVLAWLPHELPMDAVPYDLLLDLLSVDKSLTASWDPIKQLGALWIQNIDSTLSGV